MSFPTWFIPITPRSPVPQGQGLMLCWLPSPLARPTVKSADLDGQVSPRRSQNPAGFYPLLIPCLPLVPLLATLASHPPWRWGATTGFALTSPCTPDLLLYHPLYWLWLRNCNQWKLNNTNRLTHASPSPSSPSPHSLSLLFLTLLIISPASLERES